jgi:penicillin-binding protein 1C
LLKRTGITSFREEPDHYGLSMILGGGEASLWELTGMYASLSRVLKKNNAGSSYNNSDYHEPILIAGGNTYFNGATEAGQGAASGNSPNNASTTISSTNTGMGRRKVTVSGSGNSPDAVPPISAGAIWLTYKALLEVNRPESESGWQFTNSSPDVAWKTGTSFGFRDAWAVGTTLGYVIGVWAGNADGEGRPGLTGASSAAPVLFEITSYLNPKGWFERPGSSELTLAEICSESGYRAGNDCDDIIESWIPVAGLKTEPCPYHRLVHLNSNRTLRVNSLCFPPEQIVSESWFVLPPAMEYFYRRRTPSYRTLPPMAAGCEADRGIAEMEFIYPPREAGIFIPRDHTGEQTRFVAELVHRDAGVKVFWHLDDKYLGETRFIHQFEIIAPAGEHKLTAVDEQGNTVASSFTILSSPRQRYY